jgi:branched-chain amino acid transport system permease protein
MKIKANYKKYVIPVIAILVLVLLIALPYFAELSDSRYTIVLFKTIFMFTILTLSWALFSGPTGYTSLATAAFYGVGLYTAGVLGRVLPLPVMVLCGGLASFLLAVIIGGITLRLRGIYFAIFTLSSVELIKHVLHWYEITIAGGRGRPVVRVPDTTVFYVLLGILVLLIITSYLLKRSKYGLALSSIGSCEEAAAHIGVNVVTLKVFTFALSSFFMGLAGAIMATGMVYIDCFIAFDLNYSFFPTLMAIFGGMGNIVGPIIGAVVFTYLREILITEFPYVYMFIFGAVMVLTIIYLPNGLIGLAKTIRGKLLGGKHADTTCRRVN